MTIELYPYQLAGVKHLEGRSACLFDEPGLGKTAQAVVANADAVANGPILVITPLRNKIFFAASILHWAPHDDNEVIIAETAGRFDLDCFRQAIKERKRVWLITHWAALSQPTNADLAAVQWAGVIVDEAHRMRDREALQSQFVTHTLHANHFHFLTATPKDKHPGELWPMLHCCDRAKFRSYWAFHNEWVATTPQRVHGGKIIQVPSGTKNPSGFAKLLSKYTLARRKVDVCSEVPPITTCTVDIDLNGLTASYHQLEKQTYIDSLAEQRLPTPLYVPNQLARIIRLQQLTSHPAIIGVSTYSPKFEWLHDFLEGMPGTAPVLVFVKYRETALFIAASLPRARAVLGGGPAFYGWPKGIDTLVVTYGTLSEGVNLDTTLDGRTCSHVVFYDAQWSSIVQEQSINRVHRMTTRLPVTLYQLRAVLRDGGDAATVDDDILKTLDSKAGDTGLINLFLRRLQNATT